MSKAKLCVADYWPASPTRTRDLFTLRVLSFACDFHDHNPHLLDSARIASEFLRLG